MSDDDEVFGSKRKFDAVDSGDDYSDDSDEDVFAKKSKSKTDKKGGGPPRGNALKAFKFDDDDAKASSKRSGGTGKPKASAKPPPSTSNSSSTAGAGTGPGAKVFSLLDDDDDDEDMDLSASLNVKLDKTGDLGQLAKTRTNQLLASITKKSATSPRGGAKKGAKGKGSAAAAAAAVVASPGLLDLASAEEQKELEVYKQLLEEIKNGQAHFV